MVARPRKCKIEIAGQVVELDAPGLKQVPRKNEEGKVVRIDLYWVVDEEVSDYRPRTVRIHADLSSPESAAFIERACKEQHSAMLAWQDGATDDKERLKPKYDGTVGSLADCYESDPDSALPTLKFKTQTGYRSWLKLLSQTVGQRLIKNLIAKDTRRWYRQLAKPKLEGGRPRVRRAYGAIQAFKIILDYGIESGIPACRQLRKDMEGIRFAKNPPRDVTMSFEQSKAIVVEALRRGQSNTGLEEVRRLCFGIALSQALQYECTLRQVDVIGYWEPVKDKYSTQPGEIVYGGRIWRGMTMDMINLEDDLVIRTTKTGQPVVHAIASCELVVRCLKAMPLWNRDGPVAIRRDGLPWYDSGEYSAAWREIADAAGVPRTIQNRDNRASGITESGEAGATDDDISMGAGHATKATTRKVYKRSGHQASVRVNAKRQAFRQRNKDEFYNADESIDGFLPASDIEAE